MNLGPSLFALDLSASPEGTHKVPKVTVDVKEIAFTALHLLLWIA